MSVNTTAPTITPGSPASSAIVNQVLDGIQAPWDAYTPVVTATGASNPSAPAVDDGAYIRIGKTVHFRFRIAWTGSPTNGVGTYQFSLPFATAAYPNPGEAVGAGLAYSASNVMGAVTALADASSSVCTLWAVIVNGSTPSSGEIASTYGNTAYSYRICGTYECA